MIYKRLVIDLYLKTRRTTEALCKPLAIEDYVVQSIPEVSPPKWHLGHTTWFFENFLLCAFHKDYTRYFPAYQYIFNSYYETVGAHADKTRRGTFSRPTVEEIYQYRRLIDERICELLSGSSPEDLKLIEPVLTLGIHHEQQHQELLLTDIKHIFWNNPIRSSYFDKPLDATSSSVRPVKLIAFEAGLQEIGNSGNSFAFDHERPKHRIFQDEYSIASRLVTNGEFLEFIESGGYQNPALWLSDGWICVHKNDWVAPLYWEKQGNQWWTMSLSGMKPLCLDEPVCHVSYYEADAFCKWKKKRLPTEGEWEVIATHLKIQGNFAENNHLHPIPVDYSLEATSSFPILQMYGDVWEWTSSAFLPYPGFKPLAGSFGEYNGKFMCNQLILRGGSCATPQSHIRPSYRNFFTPDTRWQFTGFRLADSPSLHESK